MTKTIAHYLSSDIKVNQEFKYRQITNLEQYRSIVIGDFPVRVSEQQYPFEYYFIDEISDWPKFIEAHGIKAIHAHSGDDALKILPVATLYNIPLIVSFRGNDASAQKRKYKINQKKYKELIKHGSLFLPVCRFFKGELIKLGFSEDKIKVMYGGIDTDRFYFKKINVHKKRTFNILTVGRLVEKKGFAVLIKAFSLIHKAYPRTKLIIIGNGNLEQKRKLSKIIKKYKLSNFIEIKYDISNEQIVHVFHNADLFCLPSHTTRNGGLEGIPNVLKEAMSCGIPVISTFHAGIPELIQHKKSGLLVKENDSKALARAMIYLIRHPLLRKNYAIRARRKVQVHFNLANQIQVQEQYYALIID